MRFLLEQGSQQVAASLSRMTGGCPVFMFCNKDVHYHEERGFLMSVVANSPRTCIEILNLAIVDTDTLMIVI